MIQTHRIALLLDTGITGVREILRGIRQYASRKPNWILRNCPPRPHLIAQVRDWKPHGIIAGIVLPKLARAILRTGIPAVDVAYYLPGLKVPSVDTDHTAVGRLAAEYFLERKFVHFGYFGSAAAVYARSQESAYRRRLDLAGFTVSSCYGELLSDLDSPRLWQKLTQNTRRWLQRLPKPAAIFCCDDATARYLADICIQSGLRVPDDAALLGVGNDEMDCCLTEPALSSIATPVQRVGYEAAALLDRMISGERGPAGPLLLPPLEVVTRFSTDIVASDDEVVQAALRYIRQHAWENMRIAELVREIAVGRRQLERRFREVLGRSVLGEIQKVRVQRAKELLSDTDLPVTTIAARVGLASVRRLDVLFRQQAGMTPMAYRRQSRPAGEYR
jgi:LacI family transcriptional regulator